MQPDPVATLPTHVEHVITISMSKTWPEAYMQKIKGS